MGCVIAVVINQLPLYLSMCCNICGNLLIPMDPILHVVHLGHGCEYNFTLQYSEAKLLVGDLPLGW